MPIVSYPHDRNLITKLCKYDKVIDIKNSMTVVDDFLPVIKVLIAKRADGIFNVVNKGTISAYEIMKLYSEIVDRSHKFDILSREELNKTTVAERSNCTLQSEKIKKFGISMPYIKDSVIKSLHKYKNAL
jgi:UDP-glucose 4,6-dehydratase